MFVLCAPLALAESGFGSAGGFVCTWDTLDGLSAVGVWKGGVGGGRGGLLTALQVQRDTRRKMRLSACECVYMCVADWKKKKTFGTGLWRAPSSR